MGIGRGGREWQEGPSQPSLQEDRPQAEQKHPCQGPDVAPSGTCCIAEVCVTAGNLGVDGDTQEFQRFRKKILIRAGGKAVLVCHFLRFCKTSGNDLTGYAGTTQYPKVWGTCHQVWMA